MKAADPVESPDAGVARTTPGPRRRVGVARQLLRNPSGAIGVALLGALVLIGILGPVLITAGPTQVMAGPPLSAPSSANLLGTDQLGRDQAARMASAVPVAFFVPLGSVTLALLVGTVLGVLAGLGSRVIDRIVMSVNDVLLSVPAVLMALVIVGTLGGGVRNTTLAIAVIYLPRFARLSRASVLGIRHLPYIESATLSGVPQPRIVLWHVLPNVVPPLVVMSALSLSTATLASASLSFLGLGVTPPTADFGNMVAIGMDFLTVAPWMVFVPCAGLVMLVLGFNLLGDAVRDVLDPRVGDPTTTA
jgi:ABC-type dipeptide/oligopeptide/nickel transport system permease subunit